MRSAIRLLVLLCCAVAGFRAAPVEARRVALVIGNADYRVGPLANPGNDAAAVAETLEKQLKFDKVILKKNLGLDGFRAALRELARESAGAEFGVIYFAGHGIEVAGRNFLIPTDALLAAARDVELEAVALDTVLGQLDSVRRLKLVILDACRNNPYSLAGARRSVTRGLIRVEPEGNTLVAYAAKDGTTADDGKGRHSPFTAALLKRIVTPGLDVRRVFGYVSDDVLAATSRTQEPYLYGRIGGEEIFLHPQLAPPPGPVAPPAGQLSDAERAWATAKDSTSIAVLEAFRRQYGASNAFYDRLAEARIEDLKKQQVALAAPPKVVEPAVAISPSRTARPLTQAEERALRPKDGFKECDGCPEMVVVPAGSFMMGSPAGEAGRSDPEGPQRRVTIQRAFAVGKFEVTFAEFDACVADGRCQHRPGDAGWGRGRRPVINVSWYDAKEYAAWLSRKTGKTYRLLSEAEWEYAARAGTTTRYAFGDTITESHVKYGHDRTMEVGSFPANKFDLHDMHGNVWEWVEDAWHPNYQGAPDDGSVWPGGDTSLRVLRGGSWLDLPQNLRSAGRVRGQPSNRYSIVGFRLARTL